LVIQNTQLAMHGSTNVKSIKIDYK